MGNVAGPGGVSGAARLCLVKRIVNPTAATEDGRVQEPAGDASQLSISQPDADATWQSYNLGSPTVGQGAPGRGRFIFGRGPGG